jgi:hypothetical protein
MKTSRVNSRRGGIILVELMVAMAILVIAIIPISYSYLSDARLARVYYHRAAAMEIVDGELEILVAGAWRQLPEGSHAYAVRGEAAANLPPGQFTFTRTGNQLRLDWTPKANNQGARVVREAKGQ